MHDRDRAACQYLGLRHDGTHVWDLEFAIGRWHFRGIAFYGVPFHRRIVLAWQMHRERKRAGKPSRGVWAFVRQFSGCGCIVVLKDAWTKLTG
jgi:hypothetical protein